VVYAVEAGNDAIARKLRDRARQSKAHRDDEREHRQLDRLDGAGEKDRTEAVQEHGMSPSMNVIAYLRGDETPCIDLGGRGPYATASRHPISLRV